MDLHRVACRLVWIGETLVVHLGGAAPLTERPRCVASVRAKAEAVLCTLPTAAYLRGSERLRVEFERLLEPVFTTSQGKLLFSAAMNLTLNILKCGKK